ncbi:MULTISPECIES: Lrp/AsnC family transcriptional regulator [Thermococcus]|uniref:Transcription regulator, Lrp/AsnC family n=1 Tax=Thermococcus sibiricus (strain DSM 12597 / MM 739) TaxID=604354 RepID=C6A347_THESM|nr:MULTISPECIES: Lrp/AsnC family transcriptional regulator [Thermococcus]ACS90042.1 Transcription regulator, Lrp/AsnC family [Thermococcus sibiricus MM 739]MBC7095558.1 Lrp/AsnC family transcriptional regulator [Thermococcus sp.]
MKTKIDLDKIDIKLLSMLQEDSNISIRELSKTVNLKMSELHKRIKRLEENGVIKKFTVLLNPEKLGFNLTAFMLAKIEGKNSSYVINKLIKNPHVLEVYKVTGDYDMLLKVKFKSINEFHEFLDTIAKIEEIVDSTSMVVLKIHKEVVEIPLRSEEFKL